MVFVDKKTKNKDASYGARTITVEGLNIETKEYEILVEEIELLPGIYCKAFFCQDY